MTVSPSAKRGGHQQVFGSSHGDFVEDNFSAFETTAFLRIGGGLDVAVLLRNLRAQALQTLDMEIDGASADGASAGQRDAGAATARDERPQDERRGAHGLDQFIRRFGSGQGAGANRGAVMSSPVAEFYFGAHGGEELACGLDVPYLRNVFQNHRFVGEQSRCHARQAAFFAPLMRTVPSSGLPPRITSLSMPVMILELSAMELLQAGHYKYSSGECEGVRKTLLIPEMRESRPATESRPLLRIVLPQYVS